MLRGSFIFLSTFVAFFVTFTPITTTGQLLEAEYLNVKLPHGNPCPRIFYNGTDSIFLFGGCNSASNADILKFSISSETLEKVGSLPERSEQGSVQSDNFGNIFYLGGSDSYMDVYKFDPMSNRTTTVATFPYDVYGHVSTKYNATSNSVLILGGWEQEYELWSFDMETLITSTVSRNLPFSVGGGASVRVGNKVYIFRNEGSRRTALELDVDTYDLLPVGPPTLPNFMYYPSSVYDGNYAYVVGGYLPSTESPTDGLIQFDPITHENNFIPVRNFPVDGLGHFSIAPASIFVPSNNRIYFFGGHSYNSTGANVHDEIFYIDLTPLEPTPTTTIMTPPTTGLISSTTINPEFFICNNRSNGLYPHPTDCSMYIMCRPGTAHSFKCPPSLLFDSKDLNCDFPNVITCHAMNGGG